MLIQQAFTFMLSAKFRHMQLGLLVAELGSNMDLAYSTPTKVCPNIVRLKVVCVFVSYGRLCFKVVVILKLADLIF